MQTSEDKEVKLVQNFYFIELLNDKNERCYVMEGTTSEKNMTLAMQYNNDVWKFDSVEEAQKAIDSLPFLKSNPSIQVAIKSAEDLIKDGTATNIDERGAFCIENQAGWKVFHRTKKNEYYFDDKVVGACFWHRDQVDAMLVKFSKRWPKMTLVAVDMSSKNKAE